MTVLNFNSTEETTFFASGSSDKSIMIWLIFKS
jgi:hypothetical protein